MMYIVYPVGTNIVNHLYGSICNILVKRERCADIAELRIFIKHFTDACRSQHPLVPAHSCALLALVSQLSLAFHISQFQKGSMDLQE